MGILFVSFSIEKCVVFRKYACPYRQVQTNMYLPEWPFFKNSLAGASTYVGACHAETFTSHHSKIKPLIRQYL